MEKINTCAVAVDLTPWPSAALLALLSSPILKFHFLLTRLKGFESFQSKLKKLYQAFGFYCFAQIC